MVREGSDVVIFALGKPVSAAMEAAETLAGRGISCGVVNPIFVKPLDVDLLLGEARRTRRILTVEENVLAGGFGSAVLEALAEAGLEGVVVHRIGMPDSFIEHGTAVDQRRRLHLDAEGIAQETLSAFLPRGSVSTGNGAQGSGGARLTGSVPGRRLPVWDISFPGMIRGDSIRVRLR